MNPGTAGAAPIAARLRAEGITVERGGHTLLDSVSLAVQPGQVVGLIGHNGSGKTTLLNAICGAPASPHGRVFFDGAVLRATPKRLAGLGIAHVPQGPAPIEGSTVVDHVLAGTSRPARTGFAAARRALANSREDDAALHDHAVRLLKELGLARSAGADPTALPYALRQRVALARALITSPRLLLLDEPAAGLGRDESEELGRLIRALVTRPGRDCAVLLVEHHVSMVMQTCDAVVVLERGRVIARGTPDEIRHDPAVIEAYFGDVESPGPPLA